MTSDNAKAAFEYFVGQGLSPVQASGIVGNLQGESGQNLNPNATNKGDGRDGSDSIGIGQWNGPRAAALKAYAEAKGANWNDLTTQLEFLHTELKGPEKRAYEALLQAQTPEDAGRAFLGFERPKDWNKPGAHPERAQYAAKVFAAYGGQPGQTAPASPTAPANAPVAPAPIFGQQAPQAAPVAQPAQMASAPEQGAIFAAPPSEPVAPLSPMAAPQRRPIDLSKLRAALAAARPIFGRA